MPAADGSEARVPWTGRAGRMLRRAVLVVAIAILVLLLVLVGGVATVASTDFGRERVRRLVLGALDERLAGRVDVGRISGNLLGRFTLHDVTVADSTGAPLLSAARVTADAGLRALLSQRIVLTELTIVEPRIVLAQAPDGSWNFERLLGPKSATADTTRGLGDWVALRDVAIVDGRVLVRRTWAPDSTLAAAARDSVVAAALAGDGRADVVRRGGDLWQEMEFRAIDARLPLVRLADPDSVAGLARIAQLSMVAEPFRPPAAHVRDLRASIRFGSDSIWFRDVALRLPESRILGSGAYLPEAGALQLDLRGDSVALADLQWLYPPLPDRGTGTLRLLAAIRSDRPSDYVVRDARLRVGDAALSGDLRLQVGDDGLRFGDTRLRFRQLDLALVDRLVPGLALRRQGELTGAVALAGEPAALQVDANVTFDGPGTAPATLAAEGTVGFGEGSVRADDLRLRVRDFPLALARDVVPELPLDGSVSGEALVSGSTATRLAGRASVVYRGRAVSRLSARGTVAVHGTPHVDVAMRVSPLSLTVVEQFLPSLDLRGAVRGDARLRGSPERLSVSAELRLPAGALAVDGVVGLRDGRPRYDVALRLRDVDAGALLAAAPATDLTGRLAVAGEGIEPGTMDARLTADFPELVVADAPVGGAAADLAAADGLLTVDTLRLRGHAGVVTAAGTFGLVAGRRGTLAYRVDVDSLGALSPWLAGAAGDTTLPAARPDAPTGGATAVPSAGALAGGARDSLGATLAGRLTASGRIEGNLETFDVRGQATAADVRLRGDALERAVAEYALLDVGGPRPAYVFGARLDSLRIAGLALDSVVARSALRQPLGTAEVAVFATDSSDYRFAADFALRPDDGELRLRDVRLRFDTTTWASAHPGVVRWGGPGVAVDSLELRSSAGGRIYLDGRLPASGRGSFLVDVEALPLSHVAELLQRDLQIGGLGYLRARIDGDLRDPALVGAAGVVHGSFRGTPLPVARGTFRYAARRLLAEAALLRRGGAPLAVAAARLPVNLALGADAGPRLLDGPIDVVVRGDSIPLGPLDALSDAIGDVRGRAAGVLMVGGSFDRPALAGDLTVDLAAFGVEPLGVTLRDVAASIRLRGDSVHVDSLVGHSGGPVRVHGSIALPTLSRPSFDLRLTADDAVVLDNDTGHLRAEATLAATGPLDDLLVTGRASILGGVLRVPEPQRAEAVVSLRDPAVFAVVDSSIVDVRELLPSTPPLLRGLRVDVALQVARDTWARSDAANVELYGDLAVEADRETDQLSLQGTLYSDRGEYTFMGRRFLVRQGSATFAGGRDLDPVLRILGVHEVRLPGRAPLELRVVVGGTLESPRIALESDAQPPLSQSDMLSYLAFGRSSSSLLQVQGTGLLGGDGAGGGGLAGSVAALATRQLATLALGVLVEEAETDAASQLGVDVFNITPADLPADLSLRGVGVLLRGTEIELGEYLDRRTFVAAQLRPTFSAVPGVRVEHRLGSGLRLHATFEPRFLPRRPSLARGITPVSVGVLGSFLRWSTDW